MPVISLILATKNRVNELSVCLNSLIQQSYNDFELIIIDQNEDGRLDELIKNYQEYEILIKHIKVPPKGLSNARNIGISLSTGLILAFPDDDCWYENDTLFKVLQMAEMKPNIDGFVINWVELNKGKLMNEKLLCLKKWQRFRGENASSITLFLKRTCFEHISFDERLGVGCYFSSGEETDLIISLLKEGNRLLYTPSIYVHHNYSSNQLFRKEHIRSRERGTGALYAKHKFPTWVILRGFLKPILQIFILQSPSFQLNVLLGRLEGYVLFRE